MCSVFANLHVNGGTERVVGAAYTNRDDEFTNKLTTTIAML